MCQVLQIVRSSYYYEVKAQYGDTELVELIVDIFQSSRNNYGSRKIKIELYNNHNLVISKRRIRRIMKEQGLVSNDTTAQFKPFKSSCNEEKGENILDRNFNDQQPYQVVVSDLTYVRVGHDWRYICVLIDLFNREIIGYSAGKHKTANLVLQAFSTVNRKSSDIQLFHTDRGNEFKNQAIEQLLNTFQIQRSLSKKGCPYDNAVAEATYKIIKTEFVRNQSFESLEQLKLKLADYVNWYNCHRVHSSLGYLTPAAYRRNTLKKVV